MNAPLRHILAPALAGFALSLFARAQSLPAEVHFALPTSAPPELSLAGTLEKGEVRLELRRHSLRGSEFLVRTWSPEAEAVVEVDPPATYRGELLADGVAEPVVAALGAEGLYAVVFPREGAAWSIRPLARRTAQGEFVHVVVDGVHSGPGVDPVAPRGLCGNETAPSAGAQNLVPGGLVPTPLPAASGGPRRRVTGGTVPELPLTLACSKRCEIAFDADFEYFTAQGGTPAATVARIEAHLNVVDFTYARDLGVSFDLTQIVVRTAPFYFPVDGGSLLTAFRSEWNTNQASIPRDIAHLMTGKPGSLIEFGGLAYVGVLCSSSAYGWSMDSAGILGHEVGHNFGAPHCLDSEPCNNMCGACQYIGPNTRARKLAHMAGVNCLEDAGPYPLPVPPYAQVDELEVRQSEYGPHAIDVLANDSDGNCEGLVLAGFDAVSARGATISLAPGSSRILLWTPPAVPFLGEDRFDYVVCDTSGHLATGAVRIDVRDEDLVALWRFDDAAGGIAGDSTWRRSDGVLVGGAAWGSGVRGGAVELDGVDDSVNVPPLGLATDRFTIAGWVRRDGVQNAWAAIAFCRGGTTTAGLHVGGGGTELRYTWAGDAGTYNWNSTLTLPANAWSFVALTVEPDQARLHLFDGASWQRATNVRLHVPQAFDAELRFGYDSNSVLRRWQGALDDFRVFDRALDDAEIDALRLGGGAGAPLPVDGGTFWPLPAELAWTGSSNAVQRRVYLGGDYAGVAAAVPGGPFDRGLVAVPLFPTAIAFSRAFWRVDEILPGGTELRGETWQLERGRWHRWRLDESAGTTALDVSGGLDGTYSGAVDFGLGGATAQTGTSIRLDDGSDRVLLPALNLDANRVTISAWIRRDAADSGRAGIVFTRAGSSVAGLDVGVVENLGYHWNGASSTWSWDSGLGIPDGQWIFAALVVEPDKATIYRGAAGVLTSAVNAVSHAAEEFDGETRIGSDSAGGREFWGEIDDVRIYRGALSAAQVEALYTGSL